MSLISEPVSGSVRDESGHIWTKYPDRSPKQPWVCFHFIGTEPPEELWWTWEEILADAEGELDTL